MKRHLKVNSKAKTRFQVLFMAMSVLLLIGFQNCGSPIQVTDGVVVNTSLASQIPAADQNNPETSREPSEQNIPALPNGTNGAGPITQNPVNPFDPSTPGVELLPIEGEWASIAFEDNIGSPNGGDRDFNDAVFNYKIAELYNQQSMLTKIFIEVRLREKLSGNNHSLNLSLNGDPTAFFENIEHLSAPAFFGEANIKITVGDKIMLKDQIRNQLINVFSSTSGRKNEIIKLEITLLEPELNKKTPNQTSHSVDYKKYRFILQNHGQTGIGIDIAEINRTREMLANGEYPFGFMIPADWQPPAEGQLIDEKYPHFRYYRNWLFDSLTEPVPMSAEAASWFVFQN